MRLAALLAAAAVTGLAACATPTGPDAAGRFDAYEGTADLRGYDAVYVAPVTADEALLARIGARTLGPFDQTRALSERDVAYQQRELAEELTRQLGRVAELRDAPGPGVLTVEAQLTALDANLPTQAELADQPGLDFVRSRSVGDAAARVRLSEDGRELAVIEDRAFRRNLNDPTVGVGVWNTANQFYDRFSRKVAALLA